MTEHLRSSWKALLFALLFAGVVSSSTWAFAQKGRGTSSDVWMVQNDKPKQEKMPMGIGGGEARDLIPSVPGSPRPQSERKKPPSPDYLMAKVVWGAGTTIGGEILEDWNLAPNDTMYFHKDLARPNGFMYVDTKVGLDHFSYDPTLMPALLLSGVREVKFSPQVINQLRNYVFDGGMIICDSVYGSPWFYESSLKVFAEMFPESKFRELPADHPLYHMTHELDKVTYHCGSDSDKPFLEGLYIGSRIGVLVCKFGVGCGWSNKMDVFKTLEERGLAPKAYSLESSKQIGENLIPYIVGYSRVGEVEGKAELFNLVDQKKPTAEFVFAQVKHGGAWNAHPGAARQFLTSLEKDSSIPVNFKRVSVDLERDDISAYPFLYFTGLDDFRLTAKQIEELREHVKNDGVLVINNALGLATFHQAALRELGRVFPGGQFKRLPPNHEIFHSLYTINRVGYTPTLAKDKGKELGGLPVLFGLEIDDSIRVIYSQYDLEGGWNEIRYPLSRGYMPESAKKLGANIIMYVMTN
jgi:hypothetical protein